MNAQKNIKDYEDNIDDSNNYIENTINVRIMSYLRKLYYINNKLFNQGVFILYPSLYLDTEIEDKKIDSDNYKFLK